MMHAVIRTFIVGMGLAVAATASADVPARMQVVKRHFDKATTPVAEKLVGIHQGKCYLAHQQNLAHHSYLIYTELHPYGEGPLFDGEQTRMGVFISGFIWDMPPNFDRRTLAYQNDLERALDQMYGTTEFAPQPGYFSLTTRFKTLTAHVRGDGRFFYAWLTDPKLSFHTVYCYFYERIK